MKDTSIYNSRSAACKIPYGAVKSGTTVTFHLYPKRQEAFSRGILSAKFEFDLTRSVELPIVWTGMELGVDTFTVTLEVGDYVGLIWYTFRLEGLNGQFKELGEYQLTVYDPTDNVPDWFGQGVCYQIFPDRFCRTCIPDATGMVGGRDVHWNWDDLPHWQPNEKGEVRNRDFFGGSLKGVEEKLDYIASLGVETIYFCPIFEAAENHRYGTADYDRIDPMLGNNDDFRRLCQQAHQRGIRIILDGVFNHTGFVSKYFNGDGYYANLGARQSRQSPYYNWFCFKHWPDKYESWWGIYSLPAVNESCSSYRSFIFDDPHSVIRKWLRAGADGWRLDVADELPDDFVRGIHDAARKEKTDAIVIGEVWEDGSNKVAYGKRRRHLLGHHLDGLMNYPFRSALIDFLLGENGDQFQERMETLRENYPPFAFHSAMNALGTHDTLRILTYLGTGSPRTEWTKQDRANYHMSSFEYELGRQRLRLGAAVLFTFPGAPTVYYGDEVGMTGFEDPFNRLGYPWGREDGEILNIFRRLGVLRRDSQPLRQGDLRWGQCVRSCISYVRTYKGESLAVAVNAGADEAEVHFPWEHRYGWEMDQRTCLRAKNGKLKLTVPPMSYRFITSKNE